MEVNKRVEKAAEIIRMMSPDFTTAKSYMLAWEIVEALKEIPSQDICETP